MNSIIRGELHPICVLRRHFDKAIRKPRRLMEDVDSIRLISRLNLIKLSKDEQLEEFNLNFDFDKSHFSLARPRVPVNVRGF